MFFRAFTLKPLFLVLLLAPAGSLIFGDAAWGQFGGRLKAVDGVGVEISYSFGSFEFSDVRKGASNEVRGYTDAIGNDLYGSGPVIGFRFNRWRLQFAHHEFEYDLKDRKADVKQTPGNTADDVTVRSLHIALSSVALTYQPVRWLHIGYGREMGPVTFRQFSAAGQPETRRLTIDNPFYTFGLVLFDSESKGRIKGTFVAFGQIPGESRNLRGSTSSSGIGLYLGF